MNDPDTGKAQSIEQWLRIATHDLCDEAADRIYSELFDHYDLALEAAIEAGASPEAAQVEAVESLGDAEEAGLSFRENNLTWLEATFCRNLGRRPSIGWRLVHGGPLAITGMFVWSFEAGTYEWGAGMCVLATMIVAIILVCVVAPRKRVRGQIGTAIMVSVVSQSLFWAMWFSGISYVTDQVASPEDLIVAAWCLIYPLTYYWPLLSKAQCLRAADS